jgi:hypothetical protein
MGKKDERRWTLVMATTEAALMLACIAGSYSRTQFCRAVVVQESRDASRL